MRKLFITGFLLQNAFLFAQVGIGSVLPETTLDVRGKNHLGAVTQTDGILIPRVNSLASNGSVNGQLVYLIADASPYFKGFHYWDGTSWVAISPQTSANNNWQMTGNAGTDATTNFVGTTDNQALRFRINNTASGGIFSNNSTFLGYNTGDSGASVANTTIVGGASGLANAGVGNTIIGAENAVVNLTGVSNTIVGYNSGRALTSGSNNIVMGQNVANVLSTGSGNVTIGSQAGNINTTGNNNTNIGYASNSADNLTNATAIGAQAYVEQSNSLVLGAVSGKNGALANTSVGIGTTSPKTNLFVNGSVGAKIISVTADYTLQPDDYSVVFINDFNNGIFPNVTFPTPTADNMGQIYVLINFYSNVTGNINGEQISQGGIGNSATAAGLSYQCGPNGSGGYTWWRLY